MAMQEFRFLERPVGMPLRVLIQRLGVEDASSTARGHLDIACGREVSHIVERHLRFGANVVRVEKYWTTMSDPTGMEYCLTSRDPSTGIRSA